MRVCWQCGFDSAGFDDPCTLCGAPVEQPPGDEDAETIVFTPDDTSSGVQAPCTQITDGDLFDGRYRIDHLLGKGGMGAVYKAVDEQKNRTVALKIHHLGDLNDPAAEERFAREVEVLARIRHPAVPRILDSGRVGDNLFLVAELVEGVDLYVKLREGGPWPVDETARLGADVAEALSVAHEQRIVHRDVKPQNIMVNHSGKVFLVDFGLARGVGTDLKTLTKTGMMVGTPAYMSPEQCAGRDVDGRSDLYSLGIVMYELLTAAPPFKADSPLAMAMQHASGQPVRPSSLMPQIPPRMDRIILKCLEKSRERRFESAEALAKELRNLSTGSRLDKIDLGNGWRILLGHSEWWLVVWPPVEQKNWRTGMALRYDGEFFKLGMITEVQSGWEYRFTNWPPGEIFRNQEDLELVVRNYEQPEPASLSARIKNMIGRN